MLKELTRFRYNETLFQIMIDTIKKANEIRKESGFRNLLMKMYFNHGDLFENWVQTQVRKDDSLSYAQKCERGAFDRPHYGYCMYYAGFLAERLGYDAVSILEFGVAGGKGLLNLEKHANRIEKKLDVEFEIFGFDTGKGLPAPNDYRDFPFKWHEGDYEMDKDELRSQLQRSTLILDDVKESTEYFFEVYDPAPVGAILCDLDYHSSTVDSFNIFDTEDENTLPRTVMYFDDVRSGLMSQSNDYVGVLQAINQFNDNQFEEKIAKIRLNYDLCNNKYIRPYSLYAYHRFQHKDYNTTIRRVSDNDLTLD